MTTVRGKTAIVTGGANGIGFQCCRQLLHNGAKAVAILDLPNSNGEESAKKLNEEFSGGRGIFIQSDVTKFDEFKDVFEQAVAALKGLDILVNNAGIYDDRNWQKTIEVNFMAVVNSSLIGYDYMGRHKGGKGGIIVNIASILALVESPFAPVYSATKHAVLSFTTNLKDSYETTGIGVRVICPGLTLTSIVSGSKNRSLNFIDKDAGAAFAKKCPSQPAEYVGKALIEVIEKGENGSVWTSQACDPPSEIKLPNCDDVKLKIEDN